MFAPVNFILKNENYFLKYLHFHGASNATKSNTARIILGLDGHNDNTTYSKNIGNIDTLPRLGSAIGKTTFPILVDEANLNGEKIEFLVNNIKSAIDHQILRSKYPHSQAVTIEDEPSMSPIIFTSNPSPPNDDAYMRRIIDRTFPNSESKQEDDPEAIKFREFMRTNLKKLNALGDFRNWYIINHQAEILDDKRPPPLDLGYKILMEAYKMVGKEVPDGLATGYLKTNCRNLWRITPYLSKGRSKSTSTNRLTEPVPIWRAKLAREQVLELSEFISYRLQKLAESNFLPDIKWVVKKGKSEFRISRGILGELYRCGVTRDQCPNLRALADYLSTPRFTCQPQRPLHTCQG